MSLSFYSCKFEEAELSYRKLIRDVKKNIINIIIIIIEKISFKNQRVILIVSSF